MTTGKTYTFDVKLEEGIITVEDRICKISFLLKLDRDGVPKEPWVGTRVLGMFINGRNLSTVRDMRYLDHLEVAAKEAAKNYLKAKYGQGKPKSEEVKEAGEPYWMRKPF